MKTNRRELIISSLAAAPSLTAAGAPADGQFIPCINQVTTLEAPLEREMEAYAGAGFRHVELWLPKLEKLRLKPIAVAAALKNAGLTVAGACASDAGFSSPESKAAQQMDALKRNLEAAQ